jgi:hypothetical protein
MSKKTRGQISIEVTEIADAASQARSPVPRALDDMGELIHPGAREIATLTVIARSQDWQLKPLMQALQAASKITDWSHPWMVAENIKRGRFGPRFNWRDAPYRYYKSFEDFYQQEIETTWGKWEDLQRTWTEVIKGKISEAEARQRIERGKLRAHGGDRRSDQVDNTSNDINLKAKGGTSRSYTLARLDRDRPDLAAKVDAGLMTANAAAIEAGFRKRGERKKLTRVERTQKTIAKWTKLERRALWRYLSQEFND